MQTYRLLDLLLVFDFARNIAADRNFGQRRGIIDGNWQRSLAMVCSRFRRPRVFKCHNPRITH